MFRIDSEFEGKKAKIDVKDKKILELLSENSRMGVAEIAKRVSLKRETVSYKIKRMQDLGVIIKFFPEIDFKKINYGLYHIFLLIDETNKQRQKEFIDALKHHPNITDVMEYSDTWDLEIRMISRDIEEFDSIITDVMAQFSDIITERSKLAVINTYQSILFPYSFFKETKIKRKEHEAHKIDERDIEILTILAKNSRQSTYEIAKKVKLSADTIGLRIKKLVKSGIISKFTILPNLSLLGYSWHTFAIQMNVFDKKCELKFKTFVNEHPYIIKAVKTLGDWDALLYIISESPKEFHKTIKQIKTEFSNYIRSYDTFVAYKEYAHNALPKMLESASFKLEKAKIEKE